MVTLLVSLWTLIDGEGRGETSEIFPAGASRSLLLLETEMNQRLGTKRINILCILREAAKHYEDSRDGEDSELALVRNVEDGQVELNPEPRVGVAGVATVDPETDEPVYLGDTDGHVDAVVAVEVALECAALDVSEEWVLDVGGDRVDVLGAVLADVELRGELEARRSDACSG